MSWEDDNVDAPAMGSWEDEVDEPLLEADSWDVDLDEERAKEKQAKEEELRKKKEIEDKKHAEKAKKLAALRKLDEADPATRRELLRKAEVDADLNNAAELFDGLGIAEDELHAHPRSKTAGKNDSNISALTKDSPLSAHPLFHVETKPEFEKLRKELSTTFAELAEENLLFYSSALAIDLTRDIVKPMTTENIRKVISTLNIVLKQKEKEERMARLSKTGGTSTGGAGKKKGKAKINLGGGFKKDEDIDTTNYDDFNDDDFM